MATHIFRTKDTLPAKSRYIATTLEAREAGPDGTGVGRWRRVYKTREGVYFTEQFKAPRGAKTEIDPAIVPAHEERQPGTQA